MAQKVTPMDVRTATALVGQVENVAGFCREWGISRQTFYKYRRQFGESGLDGLRSRSRRPKSCPVQTSAAMEQLVIQRRAGLIADGCDHGPQSILWSLQRDG